MELMECKQEIKKINEYLITKCNLTEKENKFLLYFFDKLGGDADKGVYVSLEEYKNEFMLRGDNEEISKDFVKVLDGLTDKSIYVFYDDGYTKGWKKYKWLSTYKAKYRETKQGYRLIGCESKMHQDLLFSLKRLNGNVSMMSGSRKNIM